MSDRRKIEADDLFNIKLVNEPAVSPDGSRVAYTITSLDKEKNRYFSAIWLVDLTSGESNRMTSGAFRDGRPLWSPDGSRIAFVSDRNQDDKGRGQVWTIPADGGEAQRLTSLASPVEDFSWSPDGTRLVCVSKVREGEPTPDTDIRVITTIRYRFDGEGYLDNRYRQLFLVDAAGGSAKQLTSGAFDHHGPSWSPTGYEIAFAANLNEGWELDRRQDIHILRPDTGKIRQVSDGTGSWGQPTWSPDGRTIACIGTRDYMGGAPLTEVFVVPASGGAPRSLTSGFDRPFTDACIADLISYSTRGMQWVDNDLLAGVFSDSGSVHLGTVQVSDDKVTPVTSGRRRVGAINVLPDGSFVYAGNDAVSPGELFACDADGSNERQLTEVNAAWLKSVVVAPSEPFSVTSDDGQDVHGWIIYPPGAPDDTAGPALLQIHGGPFGMYGETFMHEFQMLAAQGYTIIYTNPRGSNGYGNAWANDLPLYWGIKDMPDLMAAVDWAIAQGRVDENRLGVLGGSYGGFMTNWVVSHTNRFKAAITMRTLSDLYSAFGTDDIMFNAINDLTGADPWVDDSRFWLLSPIAYVDKIETPLLIMHSEEDYRCPMGQAEQLFVSLKVLGRTTEFVRFPNESHGLSRTGQPKHRIERLGFISDWFGKYL